MSDKIEKLGFSILTTIEGGHPGRSEIWSISGDGGGERLNHRCFAFGKWIVFLKV